jgi:broad specificity phosphatase PhoE
MHFGRWEGLSWRQIAHRFPQHSRLWLRHFPHHPSPDGERFDVFKRRVTRELREILAMNGGRCVALVTHAGVVRLMLCRALGVPDRRCFRIAVDLSALSVIDVSSKSAVVSVMNR